jgi:paraquat-inducible protein B
VFIDIEPGRVKEVGVGDGRRGEEPLIRSLIERGLRAQLRTQSPVTGQLSVRLGFHPDTPVRLVGGEGKVPEIPTIPTVFAQASATAQSLVERLEQPPLDELFAHRLGTVQGLDRLVNAPELCAILRSLDHTLTTLQQLLSRVDGRVTPLADGVEKTLGTARATLRDGQQLLRHVDGRVARPADGLEDTSKVAQATLVQAQRRLDDPLQGVTAAARAIRLLADYLERNPNALLFGKGGDRR